MCERLEVSRSGFYAWLKRPASDHARRDVWLGRQIEEHFEQSYGVYGSPRIHALLPYADHVHIRPSRPGKLQTRYEENTIDWVDIIQRLKALNYQSTLSVEYVCSSWFDLNQVDTLYETAATKAALESYVGRL